VIVGAGFGGLFAAKFLRRAPVDVTLIDQNNYHLFQPLLYQVATGILSPGQIAAPIRQVLRRHRNVTVELAEVTGFDLETRTVTAHRPNGRSVVFGYDSLIVAAGVGQSYFGHDEFAEFAPGMKTLEDALGLRERIVVAFERAEAEEDTECRLAWLTFVVVGGGATGVEIAGEIAEMATTTLRDNFRRFDASEVRVVLVDGGTQILAAFGDGLSKRAANELEKVGVEVRMRSLVVGVDADGVQTKGADGTVHRLETKTAIWAAGVEASPLARLLAEASNAERDHAGRIEVLPDCSVPGHPEVFAIGDMMALNDLPGVAEVAIQTGVHAAGTIKKRVESGTDSEAFTYRDLGSMAAITRRRAIVSFHGLHLWGLPGWLVWLFVHLGFLTGFRSRFTTVISWFFSFVGRGRAERAIVDRTSPKPPTTPQP
jgi:NADH dehydrogenase